MDTQTIVDVETLRGRLPELRDSYRRAVPYPSITIDDLIQPDVLRAAIDEFPPVDGGSWTTWVHVNERKYGNVNIDTWGPSLQAIGRALMSPDFLSCLSAMTGIDNLLPDESMDGGGLHQSGRGGFLNVHADFTSHHTHKNWRRRINLLLYFNEGWNPEWGGELELWDPEMRSCRGKVAPIANRAFIFNTTEDAFHGHPDPMTCPPDRARRSMALYYFTEEAAPLTRSTNYQPRPTDGAAKSALIHLDKGVLKGYDVVKRRLGLSDEKVSKALGTVDRLRQRNRKR